MAKNKKMIWIIIGIGILLLYMNQPKEKEFKKGAALPLSITDLTNIDVFNLISGISFAGCQDDALMINVGDASQVCCPPNYEWGRLEYPQNYYYDGTYTTTARARFYYELYSCPITIPKGRYVTLSHDGTYTNIYLPSINTGDWNRLYPASTGETYYDSALTNPACTYSNGCIEEVALPLMITDLTNIDVFNLISGISFAGCQDDALMINVGDASQVCCPPNYEWGRLEYPQNYYYDGTYTTTARARFYYELYSCPITIPKGRYVTLSHDGTYTNIYLPSINTGDWNRLYPASTGETYYDSVLTNPACTYSNECIGGVTYSNFLSYKDSYLSGGDFTTFITSANKWISS